jgi:hypothetical protein
MNPFRCREHRFVGAVDWNITNASGWEPQFVSAQQYARVMR